MYCGIDLANKTSAVCVVKDGGVVKEIDCPTDEDGFKQALRGYSGLKILIEASPLTEWTSRVLEALGHEVTIIDPRRATALIRAKKKTDRLDARHLARMGESGWYHEVHRKSSTARLMRSHLRARQGLVEDRKRQTLRIRGLLRAHGVKVGAVSQGKFAQRVRELVRVQAAELSMIIELLLEALQATRHAEATATRRLRKLARQDDRCQLLMTAPGVAEVIAAGYVATLDDPRRFRRSDAVPAYFGIVPRVYQTGETHFHGRITKEGDQMMRLLMVQAGQVVLTRCRGDSALKAWGKKLQARKGLGKARVAVARKLSMILHQMWLRNEPFEAFVKN